MARNVLLGAAMRMTAQAGTSAAALGLLFALAACDADAKLSEPLPEGGSAHLDASAQAVASDASANGSDTATAASDRGLPPGDASATQVVSDASSAADADASAARDAGADTSETCRTHADCNLVAKPCCLCELTPADVVAVLRGRESSVQGVCKGGVSCGPCAPKPYEPLRAWVAPACENGTCVVRDLRKADETRCAQDQDCRLSAEAVSCCDTCLADPRVYRACRKDAVPALAGERCAAGMGCPPCVASYSPTPYCAADGHCAVRATPVSEGKPSSTCFSPDQRVESAHDAGAKGCDCFPSEEGVCKSDVAILCQNGRWRSVDGGACPARGP
jgi:hypothetical protein